MSWVDVDRPGVRTVVVGNVSRWDEQAVQVLDVLAATGRELTGAVRVVVLVLDGSITTGARSTTESVRSGLVDLSEAECDAVLAGYQDAVAWLRRADTVSVAAARGPLSGPAVDLALSCDLRVFAHDVSVTLGGPPLLGVTDRLVALIGSGRAAELALTGRPVTAAEAERLGLATRVVPGSDLRAATDDLVAGLLATDRAVLAETKALFAAPGAAAERGSFARRARGLDPG
ncbi:enoyl-CoA hydratase/isomerase family protein [Cryptosporangium arvum]|uniref:enoyl-CoA hydratase/isomerase family protein n=1 Tax=Cryptosporangium arvum TaxID=80871 RepID=UPI0006875CE4|nr:enoyl-CoA hydratase/isomerase family protein [Cryptosporangium arvum]